MLKKILIILIALNSFPLSSQPLAGDAAALVLSGGGARGAYEIAVWKALMDLDIKIGGVYGTSVGSINGTGIIMNDYKKARDLWFKISYLTVMNISPSVEALLMGNFKELSFSEYMKVIRDFREEKGLDVTPLKNLLSGIIEEDTVRKSHIDYGLVMFSVTDLKPRMHYIEQIPEGKLIDYILASANFPLFKRQVIKGDVFIDGGVYSNVPVEMAIKRGFKDIIVVDIGISTPVDIINHFRMNNDASIKYTYIKPERQFGSFLTFEPEISRKYLLEGYLDTMRVYKQLTGEEYYIYGSEDIIRNMFNYMDKEDQEKALGILGISRKRVAKVQDRYGDLVLPLFKLILFSDFSSSAGSTSLPLLEKLAEKSGLEKLSPYSQEELLKKILAGIQGDWSSVHFFDYISRLRYRKIVSFLRFLNFNSPCAGTVPEGYGNFLLWYNNLLK